jgi:hypothetical protein
MDIDYKHHFKIDGINHELDLEADKCKNHYEEYIKQKQKLEEIKQQQKNQHLDPGHMTFNNAMDYNSVTAIDPEEMTFNFKK